MAKTAKSEYQESIIVEVEGTKLVGTFREFKTGSKGYFFFGKVQLPDGNKLQISGNAVIVGTKPVTEDSKKTKK